MDNYQLNFQTWDKVAALYQEKFMDLDIYNATYDYFCQLVTKENASILEIGCGPGNITKYLIQKRPDFQIEAIDISPNMLKIARKLVPGATFNVLDAREINTIPRTFEGVMCGFCLPYLAKDDCLNLIKHSANLLKEQGILYLSTIEGEYSASGLEKNSLGDGMYFYYYEEEFLLKTLADNNFKLEKSSKISYEKPDGEESIHLILIARKNK